MEAWPYYVIDCGMNQRTIDQLDKVLALAESDHDGEALGALRMARRMLSREGLSFVDLALVAKRGNLSAGRSFFSGQQVLLEAKIDKLHDEIQAHVTQNENLTHQIDAWRRRAFELEQMLALNQAETARWKEMARETAERLWDLGQMAHGDVVLASTCEDEADELTEQEASLKKAG